METRKISANAIELTEQKVTVYEYKELLNKKAFLEKEMRYEIANLEAQIAVYQKQIDEINILLDECAKLDVTSVEKAQIEKAQVDEKII